MPGTWSDNDRTDDERTVEMDDELLPEQTRDDTDAAWGEVVEPDDDRLFLERPPHWA